MNQKPSKNNNNENNADNNNQEMKIMLSLKIIKENDGQKEEKKIYNLNEIEETKKKLKLLFELKKMYSPKEDSEIIQIGSIINWLEVYSIEITSILKMYITLQGLVHNLYE